MSMFLCFTLDCWGTFWDTRISRFSPCSKGFCSCNIDQLLDNVDSVIQNTCKETNHCIKKHVLRSLSRLPESEHLRTPVPQILFIGLALKGDKYLHEDLIIPTKNVRGNKLYIRLENNTQKWLHAYVSSPPLHLWWWYSLMFVTSPSNRTLKKTLETEQGY